MEMDSDFYCSLCKVDCIDGTGKLLHVLTEKHCIAYQLKSASLSLNRIENLNDEYQKSQNLMARKYLNNIEVPAIPNDLEKDIGYGENKCLISSTENELSEKSPSQQSTKFMKNDFYCHLCSVDCVDSTGKLLHALTEMHCISYQLKTGVSLQNDIPNFGDDQNSLDIKPVIRRSY